MGMVLKNLESPEDLASTIHASPRALAALQCQRRQGLTEVICNNLSPGARKEAVSILNCPVFENGDMVSLLRDTSTFNFATRLSTPGNWYYKRTDFEAWYRRITPADPVFSTEIPDLVAVYRIRATVNSLAADLVAYTNAMSDPEGPCPILYAPEKTSLDTLTPSELDRIQRAFLRYELLCRLTILPHLQQFSSEQQTAFNWGQTLHNASHAWDFEEVRHVQYYICSKYNLAFKEIDDDIAALVNDTRKPVNRYPRRSSPLRPAPITARQLIGEEGPSYLNPKARRLPPSGGNTTGFFIHGYIDNLCKLGIGVLRSFMKKERIGRRQFINETFLVLLPQDRSMFRAPSSRMYFPDIFAITEWNGCGQYVNAPLKLGEAPGKSIAWDAWMMAMSLHNRNDHHPFCRYKKDLRKLSWAFWDIERLKKLGTITEQSTESNIVLNFDMQVQKTYQERRSLDPELHALDQEVDFCWGFKNHHPQRKAILHFVEDARIEK